MKITIKLTLAFLGLCLVPLSVISFITYYHAERSLTKEILAHLESVARVQTHRAESIVDDNLQRLALLSSRTQVLRDIDAYLHGQDGQLQAKINASLTDSVAASPFVEEIYVLNTRGEVIAFTRGDRKGTTHTTDETFIRGMREATANILVFNEEKASPDLQLSAPLRYRGKLLGVMVVVVEASPLITLVEDYTGLGKTGETLLAKKDANGNALFITPLRFDPEAAFKKTIPKRRLELPVTQALLKNQGPFTDAVDYRGEPVLAATQYLDKIGWGLVAKIDKSEAFEPIRALRNYLVIMVTLSSLLIVGIAYFMARTISMPIVDLTRAATAIARGNLSERALEDSNDEVGLLARAFNTMTENLIEANRVLEQKVLERTSELETKNAELERYTYTVSHDLKSPLITIKGFAGMLEQEALSGDRERFKQDVARIIHAADNMYQLLDELLALSRIGRVVNPLTEVPMTELAEEVISALSGPLSKRNIAVDISPNMPGVHGDRLRLREVFQNLIDNAIKFTSEAENPRIQVGARRDGKETVFFVADNGIGVQPKYHDRMFALFDKLDSKSEGTGVGLTIVKRIIELHGGRIWVESDGVGHGSIFCFTLPSYKEISKEVTV